MSIDLLGVPEDSDGLHTTRALQDTETTVNMISEEIRLLKTDALELG